MAYLTAVPLAPPPTNGLVAHALYAASGAHGVPYALLCALAHEMSGYDVHSAKGDCRGLMGLSASRAKALDADAFNPVASSDAAAALLSQWRRRYEGSWAHALAAYHWGQIGVEGVRRGRTRGFPEGTHRFIERVLDGAGFARPVRVSISGAPV